VTAGEVHMRRGRGIMGTYIRECSFFVSSRAEGEEFQKAVSTARVREKHVECHGVKRCASGVPILGTGTNAAPCSEGVFRCPLVDVVTVWI